MIILEIREKNNFKYGLLYIDLGYKTINLTYKLNDIAEILNEKVSTLTALAVGKYPVAKINLGVTKNV